MTCVRDIMSHDVISVTADTEITKAAMILIDKHINGLPVVDSEGKLIGVICQSDIIAQQKRMPIPSLFTFLDGYIALSSIKHLEKEIRKIAAVTVGEAMSTHPVTIAPDSSIEAAASLMVDRNFHTLPVVSEGKLVGVLGKEDILRMLIPGEN